MDVKIGVNKDVDKAREIIYNYFPDKKTKLKEEDYSFRYMFNIDGTKNKSLAEKDFYNKISNVILDIILNIYIKDIIDKRAKVDWNKFKINEKKEIIEISNEILLDKDNFVVEKEYIFDQIKNYITENSFILIDGFIHFRLKEFKFFIDLIIEKGMEEFTAEKEYKEFIKILQYFVEVQEPKYNLINLILEEENYKLLDEKGNVIDSDFFSDIVAEIDSEGISKDDLLVSSLIVIAPKRLMVHLTEKYKDEGIIKVITNVFQDRVYFCPGCEKCNNKQLKLKKGK